MGKCLTDHCARKRKSTTFLIWPPKNRNSMICYKKNTLSLKVCMRSYAVEFSCGRLKKKKEIERSRTWKKEEQDGKKLETLRIITPPPYFHSLPERSPSSAYRNPLQCLQNQPNLKQLYDHTLELFFPFNLLTSWITNTAVFVK